MATVFENIPLNGLTKAHISQLFSYIQDRENHMWYYGNKEQFEKRHKELKSLIQWAVNYAYSDGIVLPKAIKNDRME